ncbi:nose resistant to fluoxetine protein 6-like isoform X2 [Bombus pyrosoma]|uniref:nose resistant to fluoxetine protein 6-like isoform X2 n=1 Tax=Bombus pyrosoma TaxID=396416 RepID=UPI001CB92685|nr:nose resistant to fluoxetine protein 6-like isoform X2 [Bombus pyrosoma]XP_043578460.1 nose resistant to fluoxetine protein 6-like isoform X2 [Bombus pyrosoma]XP_043578461.1 nose resistant to fluoxetine protein 6-like isoform X2 [Bombus pyrosoma]
MRRNSAVQYIIKSENEVALDTSGVPSRGFVIGNNHWLGDQQDCKYFSENRTLFLSEEVRKNNSIYRNPNEEYSPFEFRFFVARARHNSTMQYHVEVEDEDLVTLGLCLPASCSIDDVATMLVKVFRNETLFIGKLFNIHFKLIEVFDLVDDRQWLLSAKMISIIGVLLSLCITVIAATVYDVFIYRKRLNNERSKPTFESNNAIELENIKEGKRETRNEEPAPAESVKQNRISQYLLCFSFLTNVKEIFKPEKSGDNLRVFYGLKTLTMVWIILGHVLFYALHVLSNKWLVYIQAENLLMQVISNFTFSVDAFFFMSGFLLSYTFLKERRKYQGIPPIAKRMNNFFQKIVKRYIRLTPAYFIVILIAILNFTWHDHVSTLLPVEHPSTKCSKYWWTNILYINNFYRWDELCLTWSWYLPNDMQFFVFGSFLLTLSITHYNIAVGIGVLTLVSSIGSLAYTGYTLNYHPTLDEQYKTLTYFYIRPWCRIPPYLIGMTTCHLLAKCNYKLQLSKRSLIFGWTLAILCNCSILFGLANKNISLGLSVLYLALSRTSWALSIAWLVVACTTNNGGIVNKILSLDIFVSFSKLTYGAYLTNCIITLSLYSLDNYSLFLYYTNIGYAIITVVICSFIAAIVLSATTEMPFISLVRLYNNSERMKRNMY